ncbi:MAG: zinc metalloprotease HtpX [Chlamydiae bacterium RIFCSPHIGHO2_12_FULL_44_59]|nr:MAG: zinc metalloprotease HtpX [Chlamydiae bacterium RIFCSPHIGHO2_01_FULL_44_39]OGN57031.1 MAG: zinc metalloprotease HtpX [Chlamydiae bacterium RIFCSPHIGHO2_02_FULL_45_9]OGN61000.1 MAG: zinc metalloprotease HtpX [Chlamydiae bacterium RIFCSPHIGHO2_12_FULL_44_59]OGN66776.1 MAG: zinc metalloprotease HtpX [Chlamydiae bacterium RIFCSPLOWO2_01_FULL_44_52]OGN69970.1 MAG: zinc metalloprotease HtpX [Chlamydiae bacterium RIFCSPLOWO2_02_FULL_45_22]OGN71041.1 MAG: zinc metalloprotease HtpX [Chlamydiae 
MVKRVVLFLAVNFLVVLMISLFTSFLNLRPYLQAYGIDYQSLLIFCLIWGFGGAFISLALSRKMAKWLMGVRVIDLHAKDAEQRTLLEIVHKLSKKANLTSLPEVGIFHSNEPNAFATGPSKARSLVAVSTGLLSRMNPIEIEGVIAHEITHIANGDMVTMTLLQGVVNAFVMFLSRVFAYALSGLGRNRQQGGGSMMSYYLFTILFEIVFMVLGSLVIAAYSRYREYRADAGGARLAGKEAMISALKTLRVLQEIKDPKQNPAMAAFKISHPSRPGLLSLFATHPPLEARIERLSRG